MDIHCPRCGVSIHADDVNLDRMIAKCQARHAVFTIGDQVQAGTSGHAAAHAPVHAGPRLDVPLHDKMTIEQAPGGLFITRRWSGWQYIFLLVFAVFWDGFLFIWLSITLSVGLRSFALFSVIHVLVGIGVTYTAITGLVNTTRVTVSYNGVQVRHGPLPWRGNKRLASTDIRQVFCRERIVRSRRSRSTYYDVHAARADGGDETLIRSLPNAQQALFAEQEIERHLGIQDQPVRGELAR